MTETVSSQLRTGRPSMASIWSPGCSTPAAGVRGAPAGHVPDAASADVAGTTQVLMLSIVRVGSLVPSTVSRTTVRTR